MSRRFQSPIVLLAILGTSACSTTALDRDERSAIPEPLVSGQNALEAPVPANKIAARAKQSMVSVISYRNGVVTGQGSGFFVRRDGVLVTNLHVVQGADSLQIELDDGEVFDNIYVLSRDERRDLVLLQIPVSNAPILNVVDDRTLRVADKVYALGNPLGLKATFSDGILSARRVEDGVSYLQITSPISPGSSGGAVLDKYGNVVGISTAIMEGGQNLNLAIPARHIEGLLAIESEAMSFEAFASSLGAESDERATSRNKQSKELLASLPAHMREEFDSFELHEQQIMVRLLAFTAVIDEHDWLLTDYSQEGVLAENQVDGFSVWLGPGNYLALGVCDDDCTDLDIALLEEDGSTLARDVDLNAEAATQFTVSRSRELYVAAKMVSCETPNCGYLVVLYEEQ